MLVSINENVSCRGTQKNSSLGWDGGLFIYNDDARGLVCASDANESFCFLIFVFFFPLASDSHHKKRENTQKPKRSVSTKSFFGVFLSPCHRI